MSARFFDREHERDALNGVLITNGAQLSELMQKVDKSKAYFCEFLGENGHNLLFGLSPEVGCVQYSRSDGAPPYMMAVRPASFAIVADQEFLIGGTPTPVSHRFCLPLKLALQIAREFVETENRSDVVDWEEI